MFAGIKQLIILGKPIVSVTSPSGESWVPSGVVAPTSVTFTQTLFGAETSTPYGAKIGSIASDGDALMEYEILGSGSSGFRIDGADLLYQGPALSGTFSIAISAKNTSGLATGDLDFTVASSSIAVPGIAPAFTWAAIVDNPDAVSVQFAALPADGGSAITGAEISVDGGANWGSLSGHAINTVYIAIVPAGATTNATLRFVNAIGGGLPNSPAIAVTPWVASPADAPTVAFVAGNMGGVLTISPPADDGGAAVTAYRVEVDVDGGGYSDATTIAALDPSDTVYSPTGLTNDAVHSYRAYAVTTAGEGAVSNVSGDTPTSGLTLYTTTVDELARNMEVFDSGWGKRSLAHLRVKVFGAAALDGSTTYFDAGSLPAGTALDGDQIVVSTAVNWDNYALTPGSTARVRFDPGSENATITNLTLDYTDIVTAVGLFPLVVKSGVTITGLTLRGPNDVRLGLKAAYLSDDSAVCRNWLIEGWPSDCISTQNVTGIDFDGIRMRPGQQLKGALSPAWNSLTDFVVGDFCKSGAYLYESRTIHTNSAPVDETTTTDWLYIGFEPHTDFVQFQSIALGNSKTVRLKNVHLDIPEDLTGVTKMNVPFYLNPNQSVQPFGAITFENFLIDLGGHNQRVFSLPVAGYVAAGAEGIKFINIQVVNNDPSPVGWFYPLAGGKLSGIPVEWDLLNSRTSNRVKTDGFRFDAHSEFSHFVGAQAQVPVSGTTNAPDGEKVRVRGVSLDDAGATTTADVDFVAASGAWSGVLPSGLNTSWRAIEASVVGSSATAVRGTNRYAAGHVWAWWEQSNWHRLFFYNSGLAGLLGTVSHPYDVHFVQAGSSGAGATIEYIHDGLVNMSPAMVDMANALSAQRPGEKFAIGAHVLSGTTPGDAMTTAAEDVAYNTAGNRDWDDEARLNAALVPDAYLTGRHVGTVFDMGWISVFGGTTAAVNETLPIFTGRDRNGAVVTPASYAYSPTTGGLPRTLPLEYGGFYDMGFARFAWGGPHGRAHGSLPLLSALVDLDDYTTPSEDDDYDALVDKLVDVMGSEYLPMTLPYFGQTAGAERDPNDRAHMSDLSADGRQRLGRIGMAMNLTTLEMTDWAWPELNGRLDEAAGAYVDFWVAGRDLTTERIRQSDAAIAETAPHRTEVMGWTIDGKPAELAKIVAAAGPSGEDVCRVWPNVGTILYSTTIRYGTGSLPGYLADEDYADKVWKNWLVCDVGQADMPALPVRFRSTDALPTTLSAPQNFTIAGETTWTSPTTVMSGETSIRLEVIGKIAAGAGAKQGFGHGHASNYELIRTSAGFPQIRHASSELLTSTTQLPDDVQFEIVGVLDLANTTAQIWINGVLDIEDTNATVSGGTFGNRTFVFAANGGGVNKLEGTIESMKVWFNDPTGAGAAYETIEGNAAAVNAHIWKSGAEDAT